MERALAWVGRGARGCRRAAWIAFHTRPRGTCAGGRSPSVWVCIWLVAWGSVALALAGCGGAGSSDAVPKLVLRPGDRVGPVPTRDPLQQAVAVVFLMPQTELEVDVISGRLFAPAEELRPEYTGPHEHEGLIGLMDPQLHHQIFAYRTNGIPGRPGWDPRWGKAPYPATGKPPPWTPPRLVTRSGSPIAVVLADGQRVQLISDRRGRIVGFRWATPRGEPLVTKIRYASDETTVSGPAGVVRTYHYDARRLITEVDAPGAAAHARQDTVGGLLDSKATEQRLAYRLRSGTQERYAAYGVAPNAIGDNYLDWANTDGYQRYGVPTLADMRRVDESLRRSGVLDVAEAIPILNDRVETYTVEKPFERVTKGLHPCHVGTGDWEITYARTITPEEIATVARRLARVPKLWVYIYYSDAPSVGCASAM
jgi:hypothetical protein